MISLFTYRAYQNVPIYLFISVHAHTRFKSTYTSLIYVSVLIKAVICNKKMLSVSEYSSHIELSFDNAAANVLNVCIVLAKANMILYKWNRIGAEHIV